MSRLGIVFGEISRFGVKLTDEKFVVEYPDESGTYSDYFILLEDKDYSGSCHGIRLPSGLQLESVTTMCFYLHQSSSGNWSSQQRLLANLLSIDETKLRGSIDFFNHDERISSSYAQLRSILLNSDESGYQSFANLFQKHELRYLVELIDELAAGLILKKLDPANSAFNQVRFESLANKLFNNMRVPVEKEDFIGSPEIRHSTLVAACKSLVS